MNQAGLRSTPTVGACMRFDPATAVQTRLSGADNTCESPAAGCRPRGAFRLANAVVTAATAAVPVPVPVRGEDGSEPSSTRT
eukprot:356395-Chlamydomonas_euryale.AAC.5